MQYYFSIDGTNQQGPLDANGLRAAGVNAATMVWCEGMTDWKPAGEVPELAGVFAGAPVPPPQSTYVPPPRPMPAQPGPHVQQPLNYSPPPAGVGTGTNGLAIASLICGICGLLAFCCCPFIISILAVIFGHIARGQIKRGHGTGDGLAITGLVLGYIAIALSLINISLGITGHGMRVNGRPWNQTVPGWKMGP